MPLATYGEVQYFINDSATRIVLSLRTIDKRCQKLSDQLQRLKRVIAEDEKLLVRDTGGPIDYENFEDLLPDKLATKLSRRANIIFTKIKSIRRGLEFHGRPPYWQV